jgi:hypothetical protein
MPRRGRFYEAYKLDLASPPEPLSDYRRVAKACQTDAARKVFKLVFGHMLASGADPYAKLHVVLLPAQIEEAIRLPHRSKEQVDFIIAAADEFDACDDSLRSQIYQMFGISDALDPGVT